VEEEFDCLGERTDIAESFDHARILACGDVERSAITETTSSLAVGRDFDRGNAWVFDLARGELFGLLARKLLCILFVAERSAMRFAAYTPVNGERLVFACPAGVDLDGNGLLWPSVTQASNPRKVS
jgi:hypothetical protein